MPLPLDQAGVAGERVVRQLAEAMLFERLVEAQTSSHRGRTLFAWADGDRSFRGIGYSGAFDRIRLLAGSVQASRDGRSWRAAELDELVACLPSDDKVRARLLHELRRTTELCGWNAENLPGRSRRNLPYGALDGALDEGHAYHPCFKARTGFSNADHRDFGPEAGARFQLVWLLVRRSEVEQRLPCGEVAFWSAELGGAAWLELCGRCCEHQASLSDYALVPVHPWQWRSLRATLLAPWLNDGTAICLGEAGPFYAASQSIRTLGNAEIPQAANVKLAMNMSNSSSLRTLEPHSVCTAPLLSCWLKQTVAADALFASDYPLEVLEEYAGIIAGKSGPLAGQLAAIWRRSPSAGLQPGEQAVPFNALMVTEQDGRPFIDDWVARFGLDAWLAQLLRVAVLPVWHLLVGHGVATEAHGQNMVLVHRDGWPVRLILRDFHDSVEYVPGYLRDTAELPDFLALDPIYAARGVDEFYWMERVESLGELVADALFVFNLAEVAHLLQARYGHAETAFWAQVRTLLADYARDTGLQQRQAMLGLDRPIFATDPLLSRKLGTGRTSLPVANALFSPDV